MDFGEDRLARISDPVEAGLLASRCETLHQLMIGQFMQRLGHVTDWRPQCPGELRRGRFTGIEVQKYLEAQV